MSELDLKDILEVFHVLLEEQVLKDYMKLRHPEETDTRAYEKRRNSLSRVKKILDGIREGE